ncbi:hypothetical protein ANCDUO_17026 [Ancylostoma duodenale]|uniref:Uncharacterized protein n=1 Tax=Ancylostoma duodenale TaxID=51022 RepID=A0A0C2C9B4_9BILA|nr:hypothetical protein ANCDUO_17026 [Ancylostoma duodenale]
MKQKTRARPFLEVSRAADEQPVARCWRYNWRERDGVVRGALHWRKHVFVMRRLVPLPLSVACGRTPRRIYDPHRRLVKTSLYLSNTFSVLLRKRLYPEPGLVHK